MDVKSGFVALVAIAGLAYWPAVQAEQFTTPNGSIVDRVFIGTGRPKINIAVCADDRVAKLVDLTNFAANYLSDLAYNIVDIDTVPGEQLAAYTLVYIGSDPLTSAVPGCLAKQAKLLEFARSDAKDLRKPVAGRPKQLPPLGPTSAATAYHPGRDPHEIAFITSICDVELAGAGECRTLTVPTVFSLGAWDAEWDFEQQNGR